jgi:hypothetical protein
MAKYRTALGKVVDMSILSAKNEKTRAVGNMRVNARGDTIDANGNIIKPATNKVNEAYSKTVGNRAAQPVRKAPRAGDQSPRTSNKPQVKPQPVRSGGVNQQILEPLTPAEMELEEDLDNDLEVEQIKAQEKK